MASVKAFLGDTFGRLLFRDIEITKTHDLSAHFRQLDLVAPSLRGAPCRAGDKIQVLVPGEGMRTYTPYATNAAAGTLQFLIFVHGEGPGATWSRSVTEGDHFRGFGPRGSLPFEHMLGPIVMFGDETSFAAAAALTASKAATADLSFVFEATSAAESSGIVSALGLRNASVVEKKKEAMHLLEVEEQLRSKLKPGSTLVMTGKAQSIQHLRSQLKVRFTSHAGQKNKAYWSVGKTGLD